MKIGEARATYNAYYDKLTTRYTNLRKQADEKMQKGKKEEAGVILELSDTVLKKREEIGQFARFELPELITNEENAILAPEQAEAQKEYDSLWEEEEEKEPTSMEEVETQVNDMELHMNLPEIDMSLLGENNGL